MDRDLKLVPKNVGNVERGLLSDEDQQHPRSRDVRVAADPVSTFVVFQNPPHNARRDKIKRSAQGDPILRMLLHTFVQPFTKRVPVQSNNGINIRWVSCLNI